ncbi:MAG: hypothetical protein WBV94_06520 [Blastocatellia bacterium]
MLGSEILEVAIGVIFVYILVSIMCTAMREAVEAWLKMRATYLEMGIRKLLQDVDRKDLAQKLYDHPLITSLYSADYATDSARSQLVRFVRGSDLPSYIPSKNFALALMDIAARGTIPEQGGDATSSPTVSLEGIRKNISKNITSTRVQRVVLTAIDMAQGDLGKAQENIEAWFNSAMDRVSGWYKRSTQWILFFFGLVVAVGLNINTITIADYLYRNDAERAVVVAKAEKASTNPALPTSTGEEANKVLAELKLPMGWSIGWGAPKPKPLTGWGDFWDRLSIKSWNDFWAPILGWLMTAFAASLGAPFWFDILNRVMVIRSTVKPHEKSPEEASEDRQPKTGQANGATGTSGTSATPPVTAPPESVPAPMDAESDVDGCDVEIVDPTPDEELPESKGGVD